MKFFTLFLCIGAALAAGDFEETTTEEPDEVTAMGGWGTGVLFQYPKFYRLEAEIGKLDNGNDIRYDGRGCDRNPSCDPKVTAFIDTQTPSSLWPGKVPRTKWPLIFQISDTNSPYIGSIIRRDSCEAPVKKVNVRVHVEDSDSDAVENDLIDNFECKFDLGPRDVASDVANVMWSNWLPCTSLNQPGKITQYVRLRAYEIPAGSCQINALQVGPASSDPQGGQKPRHDAFRLDVELVKLENPKSHTYQNEGCDTGSSCDTWVYGALDTEKPLAPWPGYKPVDQYTLLYSTNNEDSPVLNKIAGRNICGGTLSNVNFRVHVVDADFTSSTDIEDFDCQFAVDDDLIAKDLASAQWSATQYCKPRHAGTVDIKLQFRYRLHDLPLDKCGLTTPAPAPGGSKFQLVLIQ